MTGILFITKTCLFKYTEIFFHQKMKIFRLNFDIFKISAKNIDYWYSLERLGEAVLTSTHNLCFSAEIRKIMYTPDNPSFTI